MQSSFDGVLPRQRQTSLLASVRPAERVAAAYFAYLAAIGFVLHAGEPGRLALLIGSALLILAACVMESWRPRPWSGIARHWVLLSLILPGYWALEWVSRSPLHELQSAWLGWDRVLTHSAGLRWAIESAGPVFPFVLETAYLLLYAIPPVSLGIVYAVAGRRCGDRYLLMLLLGTFAAYTLIPLFPVVSPRTAFPGADSPAVQTMPRAINVWMLDHLDNATSVFPSGHVAVAFSSAFGLMTVVRHRRRVWLTAFGIAVLVYAATIYGRYHYSVDGLMSIVLAAMVCWTLERGTQVEG